MPSPDTSTPENISEKPALNTGKGGWYASIALVLFALFLYGDLLISRSHTIVSNVNGDTCCQFVSWRQFGFGELAKGNIPLWNPYVFCGAPFVGNIQSAIFYPINIALYLLLPLAKAINSEVVLHTLLAGFSMMAWVRSRGTGWLAAVLAAAIVMAGSPYCFRVNLGQLNVIAVFAWLPLTLLIVDRLFQRISFGWILTGIFVVTMQLLAGYPPSVFNNAFAIAIYCGLCLLRHRNRIRTTAALSIMAIVPLLISAAPLAAGYHTMRESLRADGTTLDFATTWSLPVENLLTAFVPLFFGDYWHVTYWGRWCLWDVCVYIGVGALFVMVYGMVHAPKQARNFSGIVLVVLVLTALGRYTPFYALLYYYVPGVSSFRAPSKFLLPALVFAAMLAGLGADELLRRPRRTAPFAVVASACGICLLAVALTLQFVPSILNKPFGIWTLLIASMEQSGEAYFWEPMTDLGMYEAAWIAGVSAFIAAATCILTGYFFFRSPRGPKYRLAFVSLCIAEILCFSRTTRETVNLDSMSDTNLLELRHSVPGDYRVLQAKSFNPNWRRSYPMDIGMMAPWGYDPVMLDRYARFYCFALGGKEKQDYLVNEGAITNIFDPLSKSLAESIFRFSFEAPENGQRHTPYPYVSLPSLFRVARCRYVYFWPEDANSVLGGVRGIYQVRDPLPHFAIYRDYRVVPHPDNVLREMTVPGTDLKQVLFLESEPFPKPQIDATPEKTDTIAQLDHSTDQLTVEVDLATPGLLFITDAYSNGWRAEPLPGSVQQNYEIVPADYAFQAIPLDTGHHVIRLKYAPTIVTLGIWITAFSSGCFAAACGVWCWMKGRGRRIAQTAASEN